MIEKRNPIGGNVYTELEENIIFGGRLGMYQYYGIWQVIDEALKLINSI